jgi:ABC-type lipoprotein export system ATPase subunit/glycosyltransferase involved in cell wall biosynthesis
MRDNALAVALKQAGHSVTLIPLYTPLRTDEPTASINSVYYGGVNVYLQHASTLFRHTPRLFNSMFDQRWLLKAAGDLGAQTQPEKLADFTMDVLQGEDGSAHKELDRLVDFIKQDIKPQVVSLPNLMFIGFARTLRRSLGVPLVCELTGEDVFLEAMKEKDRARMRAEIRSRCGDVTRFVATSEYYANAMAEYLAVPRSRIDVVYPGIGRDMVGHPRSVQPPDRPPTIGYMARVAPEKGLDKLLEAFKMLRQLPGMERARLKAAGYLGAKDKKWFAALQKRVASEGLSDAFDYIGEVDRAGKLELLDSIDVFSVPAPHPEPKGIYVLEAWSRGVPVVLPEHGSFPELMRAGGGGVLTPWGDPRALAYALADLLRDRDKRDYLGRQGRTAVESGFLNEHMAAKMVGVYDQAIADLARELHGAADFRPLSGRMPTESLHPSRPDNEFSFFRRPDMNTSSDGSASLVVEDLWKEYPTPTEPLVVLKGVGFSIGAKERLAIVGPSGSGKSTLLNILGTLDRPTRGTVRLQNADPFTLKSNRLAAFRSSKIGFIFQDHHLLPQCTAVENILVARLALSRVRKPDVDRAMSLLEMVGLADRASHLPSELSGGERQRVAIARALMNGPQLLLCDEPTGNLDAKSSRVVGELLLRLADQTHAILVTVTHSPMLAEMFSRTMRMTDGVLVEGPAETARV